jgi:hypothetical protein
VIYKGVSVVFLYLSVQSFRCKRLQAFHNRFSHHSRAVSYFFFHIV